MKTPQEDCSHGPFEPLGFEIVKTTDTTIEAVAAIFCQRCGSFRTKVLVFRREFTPTESTEITLRRDQEAR